MNKPQVKIETFKKINGEIQIDYNGAYVGSLRPSPPWFKEDGIDTESIANLIESAPEMLRFITFIAETNKGKYDENLPVRDNFHSRIAQRIIARAEGK